MSIMSDINQSNEKANKELAQKLDKLIEQNPNAPKNISQPPSIRQGNTIINVNNSRDVQIGNNNNNTHNEITQQTAKTNTLKKFFMSLLDWILKHLRFSHDEE